VGVNINKGVIFCWGLVVLAAGFMLFGPTPGAGNQDAAVKAAVDGYVRAFAAGDGKAACDALTEPARQAVAGLGEKLGAGDCISAMEKTHEIGGSKVAAIAKGIRVGKVDVKGGRAKVTLKGAGQDSIAELERTEKGWKISSLPRA
jgi:hypothetical protein